MYIYIRPEKITVKEILVRKNEEKVN